MKQKGITGDRLGFFTRADVRDAATKKGVKQQTSVATLHRLGVNGVKDMNPEAHTLHMAPSGSEQPVVYFLGEAPGRDEDRDGEPFVGPSGAKLRAEIPVKFRKKARFNNCCRTLPPKRGGSYAPIYEEIECYRPSVEDDIVATKPKLIFAVGGVALSWCFPGLGSIKLCRGRLIPFKLREHVCWVAPILHPAYILRVEDGGKEDDVTGAEWKSIFEQDIARAFDALAAGLEEPYIEDSTEEGLLAGVTLYTGEPGDLAKIEAFLKRARKTETALDIETNRLRCYEAGAKCMAMSLGGKGETISFPWDHPQGRWTKRDREALGEIVGAYLTDPARGPVTIQNLGYEQEWFCHMWPDRIQAILRNPAGWHDTIRQGYVLDERPGGHNLNFLSVINLGFPLKAKSGAEKSHAEDEPLIKVLRYNALDSKYTRLISKKQMPQVEAQGLTAIYQEEVRRVASCVLAQRAGLPVDEDFVRETSGRLQTEIDGIYKTIFARPEVKKFNEQYRRFNPASNDDLIIMFRDVLKRPEGQSRKRSAGYTTEKKVLQKMTDCELAGLILEARNRSKLKSTYCDSFTRDSLNTLVYPDGLLHTTFLSGTVRTGRLASEGPNLQNFPKRKDAWIRKMIRAAKGWLIVAMDFAQQEARVIAMASLDKKLIASIKAGHDIHMDWTEKIIRIWPKTFKKRGGDKKAFRADVKNQWTFPAFYGSEPGPIAAALEMPENLARELFDEFWDEFAGVKAWQDETRRKYAELGYVEGLSGRRRHAPLDKNQIINTPVQGDASDIVVDAMNRLSEGCGDKWDWFMQPRINIHDDLTFIVPESQLEFVVTTGVGEMLACEFPWLNGVPLAAEVSCGENWFELEEIGTFRSEDL